MLIFIITISSCISHSKLWNNVDSFHFQPWHYLLDSSGFSSLRCTSAGFQAARICSNHPHLAMEVEAQVWINSLATPNLRDRDREITKIVLSWWGFRLVWLEGTFLSTRKMLSVFKDFITWYTNYICVGDSLCSELCQNWYTCYSPPGVNTKKKYKKSVNPYLGGSVAETEHLPRDAGTLQSKPSASINRSMGLRSLN